jgi:hypothetical protein
MLKYDEPSLVRFSRLMSAGLCKIPATEPVANEELYNNNGTPV